MTLVELMIGVALSLLVILAVTYVFSASRASYRHQESFSAVQESGRIALEVLARDIRMSGNPGCGSLLIIEELNQHLSRNALVATNRFSNAVAILGNQNTVTLVRGGAENTLIVATPAANQLQLADVSALGTVAAGDRLLLSDCLNTMVVEVLAAVGNVVTVQSVDALPGNPPARQFRPGSQVMRLERVVFARNANNELTRNGQPIVAGVTALSFQFGVDTGAFPPRNVQRYLDTPSAAQLGSVLAVRVNMTLSDRDVNMPFGSTITLRNRAP